MLDADDERESSRGQNNDSQDSGRSEPESSCDHSRHKPIRPWESKATHGTSHCDVMTPYPKVTIDPAAREVVEDLLELVELKVSTESQKGSTVSGSGDASRKGTKVHSVKSDDEDDDDIQVIEEKLPIDVSLELTPVPNQLSLFCKRCRICNSKKMLYQKLKDGKTEFYCSDKCLLKCRLMDGKECPECLQKLPADSMIFRPKFGSITSALCSEECLSRYEDAKGPKAKCRSCLSTVSGEKTYHWQTMDFCSAKCVEKVLRSVGEKCVNCKLTVAYQALGKYSVRFGDVVRQFCAVKCLDMYKKRLKSCTFCQKELTESKVFSYFQDGSGLKSKEFCNNICLSNYKELQSLRRPNPPPAAPASGDSKDKSQQILDIDPEDIEVCSVCSCVTVVKDDFDHIRIDLNGENFFLCSPKCVSGFRQLYNIKSLICDGCYKYNWSLAGGTVLRYSGKTKIFCSRRCQSLYVLRVRKITNCSCCRVKKYLFDLVEEYNTASGEMSVFCSINCMNLTVESSSIKASIKSLSSYSNCPVCKTKKQVQFYKKWSCGEILSFCSFSCVNQFLQNPSAHVASSRTPMPASVAAKRAAESVKSGDGTRWTPGQAPTPKNVPQTAATAVVSKNNLTPVQSGVIILTSSGDSTSASSNQVTYCTASRPQTRSSTLPLNQPQPSNARTAPNELLTECAVGHGASENICQRYGSSPNVSKNKGHNVSARHQRIRLSDG